MPRRDHGMTLLEALIALAIFAVVLSLAYGAITGSLRVQNQQEALTTTQAKLRRIIEVISQDLRSAVFGSITDDPYIAGPQQVSFMMLTGGAGYAVMDGTNFSSRLQFDALIPADSSIAAGQQVALVNTAGLGVVVPVTHVSGISGDGTRTVTTDCRLSIPYESGVLMFQVETTGLRYEPETQNMFFETAGVDEQPFAFDLSDVRFDYVYTFTAPEDDDVTGAPSQTVIVETEPRRGTHGLPVRSFVESGFEFTLTRLQVVAEAVAEVNGRQSTHAFSGQVDLSRAAHFKVEEIVPCG